MRVAVLDAAAIVGFLEEQDAHAPLHDVLSDETTALAVPHVCDLEVASALRSAVARGSMTLTRAAESLGLYLALPFERFDHVPLLARVFDLRDNFSPYDAAYVALAEAAQAPLFTSDTRLAAAVRRFTDVEVVEV